MITDTQICRFYILKTFAEKYFLTTTLAFLLCISAFAQVQDNFADGNFSTNPPWQGTGDRFTITTGQLRLNALQEAGAAWLTTASAAIRNASWQIRLTMAFNPSANNYTRIYLTTDQTDLAGSLNGYFVMVGNTEDEISLYRQTGTTRKKIIDGTNGRTNTATTTVRIQVTRDADGNWQLFSDTGATGTYTLEGLVKDTTYTRSDYFGIYCNYTATRSDKFYFDDVRVTGSGYPDNTPPAAQTVAVRSGTILDVTFSEPVEQSTATSLTQYTTGAGLEHPQQATLQADRKTVRLVFAKTFPQKQRSILSITGVRDIAGNTMLPAEAGFVYFNPVPPLPRDVIITEIMSDPTPAIALPETEFVEIFNRGQDPFDLVAWTLTDGTSDATLPHYILLPGEYAVVTADANLFAQVQNKIGTTSFPTLNNTGDMLILLDSAGNTIDSLTYADTWYKSGTKKEGGWTLERIDPEDPCRTTGNWTASEAATGGTPGKENSVFANNPDHTGPGIVAAIPVSPDTLKISFNERLENAPVTSGDIHITPGIDAISAIHFADAALTGLKVVVKPPFKSGVMYTLIAGNIRDCSGNTLSADHNTVTFALPEPADSLDIVVNEILFNPRPTGVDFLEVLNTSHKFINLKNWSLASLEEDGTIKTKKPVTTQDHVLAPGAYRVFTEDIYVLKSEYLQGREENFLETSLPALNDDAGTVVLLDAAGNRIDQVSYTEKQHSVFIRDPEGVSLERIQNSLPASNAENWKSGASAAGFATPGYLNSNATERPDTDDAITIEPEVFVPIYGNPDFTRIEYRFDKGGYIVNARVYDAHGHLIKEIARNEQLGTEGFFRWDGDRDNGTKARVGQYMLWLEVFNEQGDLRTFHKRVVIAEKF